MTIGDQITQDMKAAMLAKDGDRLGALRMIRAEFLKAEKEKGQKPDEQREMVILQSMVKQRRESIEQFELAGRSELAQVEKVELAVIESYLPQALTAEEIEAAINEVLASIPSPATDQMGKIMGQVMGKLKQMGKPFDGKVVNERVRQRLAG